MRLLVRFGAFNFTKKNKKELLREIHTLISPIKRKDTSNELFEGVHKEWKLPNLTSSALDEAFDGIELKH
jgi:DNA polymerase-3 subunit alpha